VALDYADAIRQLGDKQSSRRRAAAKRLRQLADPAAGGALLASLRVEVPKPRSWETQYQMVMALGACGHTPALQYLKELAGQQFEATAVHAAIGDAIVRLGRRHDTDPTPVYWCLELGNDAVADGALRAVAMLRLQFDDNAIERIIGHVDRREPHDGLRYWVAAAAAGWSSGPATREFLTACAEGPRTDIAEVATESLTGHYRRFTIL
jgi:HEAT repeat protein